MQSSTRSGAMIATQLPLAHTVTDFWAMCVDYKCQVIVHLTDSQHQNVRIARSDPVTQIDP